LMAIGPGNDHSTCRVGWYEASWDVYPAPQREPLLAPPEAAIRDDPLKKGKGVGSRSGNSFDRLATPASLQEHLHPVHSISLKSVVPNPSKLAKCHQAVPNR
jgi:hypothetical protein